MYTLNLDNNRSIGYIWYKHLEQIYKHLIKKLTFHADLEPKDASAAFQSV